MEESDEEDNNNDDEEGKKVQETSLVLLDAKDISQAFLVARNQPIDSELTPEENAYVKSCQECENLNDEFKQTVEIFNEHSALMTEKQFAMYSVDPKKRKGTKRAKTYKAVEETLHQQLLEALNNMENRDLENQDLSTSLNNNNNNNNSCSSSSRNTQQQQEESLIMEKENTLTRSSSPPILMNNNNVENNKIFYLFLC